MSACSKIRPLVASSSMVHRSQAISGLVLSFKRCCLSVMYSMARYSWREGRTGAHRAVFMNMQSSHVHVYNSIKVPCRLG